MALTVDQVRERLRDACDAAGSQRQWALANGIEPVRVNLILSGREQPSARVLEALGLERKVVRVVTYDALRRP